jgi:hypothetical protein
MVTRWLGDRMAARAERQLAEDLPAGAMAFVEHHHRQTGRAQAGRRRHAGRATADDADLGVEDACIAHGLPPRSMRMPSCTTVMQARTVTPSSTTRQS